MSDNEARARENQRKRANTILLDVFDGDQSSFSAADVAIVAAALDEAELRGKRAGRIEGLTEALEPCGCERGRCEQAPETDVVYYGRLCRDAIAASIADLSQRREG